MTFKDLKKRVGIEIGQRFTILQALKGKPFWIWDLYNRKSEDAHTSGNCCINHIVGLPRKNGLEMPIFYYEKLVTDNLLFTKYLWVKKATGLSISELLLRYMNWLCLKDDALKGSQMCIITGPRIDLAVTLIERMKGLFRNED